MTDIYRQHDAAFAKVSAYVITCIILALRWCETMQEAMAMTSAPRITMNITYKIHTYDTPGMLMHGKHMRDNDGSFIISAYPDGDTYDELFRVEVPYNGPAKKRGEIITEWENDRDPRQLEALNYVYAKLTGE